MKYWIWIIVLLVVLVIGGLFLYGQNASDTMMEKNTQVSPSDTMMTEESPSPDTMMEGSDSGTSKTGDSMMEKTGDAMEK